MSDDDMPKWDSPEFHIWFAEYKAQRKRNLEGALDGAENATEWKLTQETCNHGRRISYKHFPEFFFYSQLAQDKYVFIAKKLFERRGMYHILTSDKPSVVEFEGIDIFTDILTDDQMDRVSGLYEKVATAAFNQTIKVTGERK